jgi:hypothetical protein
MEAIKKLRTGRFAAFVILVVLSCATLSLAISNGTLDTVHTYTGAIIVPNVFGFTGFTGGNGFVSCSGSLVSRRVVLTAGHCINMFLLFSVPPSQLHVDFDPTNVYTPSSSWRNVASYALMPGFQLTSGSVAENDIGVVILADPVHDIAPAQLAPVGFLDSYPSLNKAIASVLGYGLNEQLVFTGNRLITTSNVINLNDVWLKRSETPGGICPSDSGGPTLLIQGTTEYQVGIHSSLNGDVFFKSTTVLGCGENNYDTRVDTAAVQSFIQTQIAANP